jgi:hypothetical protein
MTSYADTKWYRTSEASDRAVAKKLMAQLETLHRMGVAHADLLLKNVLRTSQSSTLRSRCGARLVGESSSKDYEYLIGSLYGSANTRGVAFCIIEHLLHTGKRATAREAFIASVGYIADDAEKWHSAEVTRQEREEAEMDAKEGNR